MEAEETSCPKVSLKSDVLPCIPSTSSKRVLQRPDKWGWDVNQKSPEVTIFGKNRQTALFHSTWSSGAAGVRGERILNAGPPSRHYWEVRVGDRIFGTSMMFGIGTKKSCLHVDSFVNLIGSDDQGWGLSHKGLLWHNDQWISFTKPFVENKPTTIGLLFDAVEGTLSYFKDGVSLGVAFTGLNLVKDKLYPMVASTAAKTEVTLRNMQRDFFNLQDRCRQTILDAIGENRSLNEIDSLELPRCLINMIKQHDLRDVEDGDEGFDEVQVLLHEEKSDILGQRLTIKTSINHFPSNSISLQWQSSSPETLSYPVVDY